MEKLIPLISDIQEIIRKSDVSLEISLPMIAVVGSQSTGNISLMQVKAPYWRVLLDENSYQKAKVSSPVGLFKFSLFKYKVIKNLQSLSIRKENITKTWRILGNKSNNKQINFVEAIKESAQNLFAYVTTLKKY